jgi:CheY-like chemotaxis protein
MTVVIPRVLVVSESRITRRVVEMTFADQPVELVVAITGPAGLAAWNAQPSAVVLADVAMDGTDGLALARRVQATAGGRPAAVLLMAGQHDVVDDAANAAADVRGVIHKPLDSLQLIEAVREVLRASRPPRPAPPVAVVSPATLAAAEEAERPVTERLSLALDVGTGNHGAADQAESAPAVALADQDLERVAVRVAALWGGDARHEAERLVREMAPALVQEVARLVVADVSERLVREEIARMRSAHVGR